MSQDKNQYYKNEIVHTLAEAIKRGGRSLQSVPGLLAKCISEDLWVERDVNGQIVKYDKTEFKRFVEAPFPEGLDSTLETIERLCSDEIEIIAFIAEAKRNKVGRPPKTQGQTDASGKILYNVQGKQLAPTGNSKEAAIQRLQNAAKEDKAVAEIYKRVLDGELKPTAALVEAGFRPRKVAVNMDNAESAYRTITGHMHADVLQELIDMLTATPSAAPDDSKE